MSATTGQGIYTAIGQQISLPLVQSQVGLWPIASIQIDNGTAATLQIQSPSGGPVANVRAYQFRTFPLPNLDGFRIVNQGGQTIQDSDMLTVVWSEASVGPFVGSYGLEGDTFYRVIDIALNGGIYQGTGTFDDPETGLKIFQNAQGYGELDFYVGGVKTVSLSQNGLVFDLFPLDEGGVVWDSSSLRAGDSAIVLDANGLSTYSDTVLQCKVGTNGQFEGGSGAVIINATGLGTYDGTALQCLIGTDGILLAGGGVVELGAAGIGIAATSSALSGVHAYTFHDATQIELGGLYGYSPTDESTIIEIQTPATSRASDIYLTAQTTTGFEAVVRLESIYGSSATAQVDVNATASGASIDLSAGSAFVEISDAGLAINSVASINLQGDAILGRSLQLAEQSVSPPVIAGYGHLSVGPDGSLYYTSPGGVVTQVAPG